MIRYISNGSVCLKNGYTDVGKEGQRDGISSAYCFMYFENHWNIWSIKFFFQSSHWPLCLFVTEVKETHFLCFWLNVLIWGGSGETLESEVRFYICIYIHTHCIKVFFIFYLFPYCGVIEVYWKCHPSGANFTFDMEIQFECHII